MVVGYVPGTSRPLLRPWGWIGSYNWAHVAHDTDWMSAVVDGLKTGWSNMRENIAREIKGPDGGRGEARETFITIMICLDKQVDCLMSV